jgi:hypothetical protein
MDDLPWGEASLVRIGSSHVELELAEGSFGQEVDPVGEGFESGELIFDEAVNSFDVALAGVGGGRDAIVLRAKVSDGGREVGAGPVGLELADEFTAVVGWPGQVPQLDAPACRVDLNALREERAGLGGTPRSISEELQAAARRETPSPVRFSAGPSINALLPAWRRSLGLSRCARFR